MVLSYDSSVWLLLPWPLLTCNPALELWVMACFFLSAEDPEAAPDAAEVAPATFGAPFFLSDMVVSVLVRVRRLRWKLPVKEGKDLGDGTSERERWMPWTTC